MSSLPMIPSGLRFFFAEKLFAVMGGCRTIIKNISNRGLCYTMELLWQPAAHTIASSALTPSKHVPQTADVYEVG